jgi:hypothetical protein
MRDDLPEDVFDVYIEVFYNRQCLHGSLGYSLALAFESLNCVA